MVVRRVQWSWDEMARVFPSKAERVPPRTRARFLLNLHHPLPFQACIVIRINKFFDQPLVRKCFETAKGGYACTLPLRLFFVFKAYARLYSSGAADGSKANFSQFLEAIAILSLIQFHHANEKHSSRSNVRYSVAPIPLSPSATVVNLLA